MTSLSEPVRALGRIPVCFFYFHASVRFSFSNRQALRFTLTLFATELLVLSLLEIVEIGLLESRPSALCTATPTKIELGVLVTTP